MREVCREHSIMLALWKAMQILLLLLLALDFTRSPFLFLCLLLKVFSTAGFFSSSQRAVSVISKGRSVLAGLGAFLIKQTP